MKFVLPSRKLLLVIVILSLVNPVHYALLFFFPVENSVFLGYPDDNLMLSLMKSPAWGFDDPWSFDGGKVWHNPLIGSVYFFILLGIVPLLLNANLYLAFIFFKFLFSILYFIVVYNLISLFLKNQKQRTVAMLVFMLVAGLGGILYVTSLTAFPNSQYSSVIGYALTNEFNELSATSHSLTHTFRLYYLFPEMLGYLSLIFYILRKRLLTGVALGFVFLFYPTYSIAFSLAILIYELMSARIAHRTKERLINLISVYFIAGLFSLPWLVTSLQRPYYYKISSFVFEDLPTINILVGFFFSLVFVLYFVKRKSLMPRAWVAAFSVIMVILFMLKQFYEISLRSPVSEAFLAKLNMLDVSRFLANYSLMIDLLMIVLAGIAFIAIYKSKIDANYKFLVSLIVVFVVLSGISPDSIGRLVYTGRQAAILIFPISVLAALGILEFSKRIRKSAFLVVGIIIILSLPSLLGYNLWLQKSVRQSGISGFFAQDEYSVLNALKSAEDGNVMSSVRLGAVIPYYTDKKAVLFSGRIFDGYLKEAHDDYFTFYSSTDADRIKIINKYKIKYVVVSSDESDIIKFDPDKAGYLEKILGGTARLYRVNL